MDDTTTRLELLDRIVRLENQIRVLNAEIERLREIIDHARIQTWQSRSAYEQFHAGS